MNIWIFVRFESCQLNKFRIRFFSFFSPGPGHCGHWLYLLRGIFFRSYRPKQFCLRGSELGLQRGDFFLFGDYF